MRAWQWFKRWFLDGWLTTGPQVACRPGQVKAFTCCVVCGRVLPHWAMSLTAAEAKKRGYIGCKCGGMRIQPVMISPIKAVWWFVVRGWFVRKVVLRARLWDPRMPVLENDFR